MIERRYALLKRNNGRTRHKGMKKNENNLKTIFSKGNIYGVKNKEREKGKGRGFHK